MPAHSLIERLRWWWFGAAIILFAIAIGRVTRPFFTNAQIAPPTVLKSALAGDAAVCQKVGNNPAVPFPKAMAAGNFNEGTHTLALLVATTDEPEVIRAINEYAGTVIVRHFGGGKGQGLSGAQYAESLNRIAAQVNGKRFLAFASRNEANCSEYEPIDQEVAFAKAVTSGVTAANVELIVGQIDYYCGKPPGASPVEYLNKLQDLPNIKGVALPFYTGVAGGVEPTVSTYKAFAGNVRSTLPIYITEAGPLKGSLRDFAEASKQIMSDPQIKAFLLFNSHGTNPDPNFEFARPFWNAGCRQALREQCQDVDAVVQACGESKPDGSTNNYYEYNLKRDDPEIMATRLADSYSLSCLPRSTFRIEVSSEEKCGFVGCTDYKPTAKLTLDTKNSVFSLFRDEDRVLGRVNGDRIKESSRLESIESFLSSRTTAPPTRSAAETFNYPQEQAPIFKNTTLDTQCQTAYYTLLHVESLCQENLVQPGSGGTETASACALDKKIGSTNFTHSSLLKQFELERQGQPVAEFCQTLVTKDSSLRQAMLQVNSALELAYRPAFIGFLTRLSPKDPAEAGANRKFIFPKDDTGMTRDFILFDYVEVRVPDFGSDRPVDDPNTDRDNYQDPLRQTANLFLTKEQIDAFNQDYAAQREALRATKDATAFDDPAIARFVSPGASVNDLPVRCLNKETGNLQECDQDPVAQALLHFMNASLKADVPNANGKFPTGVFNRVGDDYTECDAHEEQFYEGVSDQPSRRLAEEAASINSSLEPKNVGNLDKRSTVELELGGEINLPQPTDGGGLTVKALFITPHNYNLALADMAFLTRLTQSQQNSRLPIDQFPGVLRSNDAWDLEVGQRTGREKIMPEPEPDINVKVNLVPAPNPTGDKPNFFTFLQKTAGRVASVPTRLFTLLNTSNSNPVNAFTRGCELSNATENWLLGKCTPSGPAPTKDQQLGDDTQPDAATQRLCIEVFITDDERLQQYAKNVKEALAKPEAQDLWNRYYAGYKRGGYQHLFGTCTIEGQSGPCYERVVDALVDAQINPYLGVAIALNETGGLKSESITNEYGPHWGCGWDGTKITSGKVENKFSCMKGYFLNNQNLASNASLSKYGYKEGNNNKNLSKIIGLIDRYADGPSYNGCGTPSSN